MQNRAQLVGDNRNRIPNCQVGSLKHITFTMYYYLQNKSQAEIKINKKFRTYGVDRSPLTLFIFRDDLRLNIFVSPYFTLKTSLVFQTTGEAMYSTLLFMLF